MTVFRTPDAVLDYRVDSQALPRGSEVKLFAVCDEQTVAFSAWSATPADDVEMIYFLSQIANDLTEWGGDWIEQVRDLFAEPAPDRAGPRYGCAVVPVV